MKASLIQIILFIFFGNLMAQTPEWRYLGNGDKVNKFIETSDYYWQATEGGLLKTDKKTNIINRFDRTNSLLFGNSITGLAIDGNGDLWVASISNGDYGGVTRHNAQGIQRMLSDAGSGPLITGLDGTIYFLNAKGLYHFINNKWDTINVVPMYQYPGAMAVDPTNGDIWFTSYTFGQYSVTHYNGIIAEIFDSNQGLPFENPVNQPIAISPTGEIYVSTGSGIFKKTNNSWTNIKTITGNEIISAIAINTDGVLYACYQPQSEAVVSIIKYENNQWVPAFDGPIVSYFGYTINEMSFSTLEKDKLILPSAGYGCWVHQNNGWKRLDSQHELAEVRLTQLSHVEKNMWVVMGPVDAYDSIAILRYDGKDFNNGMIGLPPKFNDTYLSILGNDGEGLTWARTQYALYKLENNSWIKDSLVGIPDYNPAFAEVVAGSNDGRTLLYHNSFAYLKSNGVWNAWAEAPQSTSNTSVLWSSNGRLFVSTYYGWSYFDGNVWKNFNISYYPYIKFIEAPDHSVYIFTGYQLLKLDQNSSTPGLVPIPSDDWSSMTLDSKGNIWLASVNQLTVNNGLNWTSYDRSTPGYIGGAILNIEADNNDNIWIASYYNGLELFNTSGIVTNVIPNIYYKNKLGFNVYPNPSNGELTLKFNSENKHQMELINVNGSVLGRWSTTSIDYHLQLPNYISNGIYWIREVNCDEVKPVPFVLVRE